jgi:phage terminase small subunit
MPDQKGSKPLKNAKHERFAQGLGLGLTGDKAYIKAGYTPNRNNASRLKANESIKDRLAYLIAKGAEIAEISIADVITELGKIGFANMMDYVEIEGGDPIVDLSAMTHEQAAAIGEITVETYMEGKGPDAEKIKRTKLKLLDKRAALVDIGKHLGAFKEDEKNKGNVTIELIPHGPPPVVGNGTAPELLARTPLP